MGKVTALLEKLFKKIQTPKEPLPTFTFQGPLRGLGNPHSTLIIKINPVKLKQKISQN
jgi:hypothetical protein